MSKSPFGQPQVDPLAPVKRGLFQLFRTLLFTRQKLYALEVQSRMAAAGRSPKPNMPVEFRSQYGEDLLIYDMFDGKFEGFYIEVGAFDGYNYAVTYGLEAMGWTGLLIEAIPDRAEQCRQRRPGSRVVNAALSRKGSTGTAEFTVTTDQYGGMLSYLNTTPDHLQAIAPMARTKVTVPVTTMDDLLKDHTGEIDVASIDVEGGEVQLLQGFDLHKHKPKLLLLEDNSTGRDANMTQYMATQPYVLCAMLEVNRVYVRSDLIDMQNKVKALLA